MRPLIALCLTAGTYLASQEADLPALRLPPSAELGVLAQIVSETLKIPMQYDPGQLRGMVWLRLPERQTKEELWRIFNQALAGQNQTLIVSGDGPLYQIVEIGRAAEMAKTMTLAEFDAMPMKPGFATVCFDIQYAGAENVVKVLSLVLTGRGGLVKSLGAGGKKLIISGTYGRIQDMRTLLSFLDRKGVKGAIRTFVPTRSDPTALMNVLRQSWTALSQADGENSQVAIQPSADNRQLLLIAPEESVERLLLLAGELDKAEPVEERSYRPQAFALEDVARLLEQVLAPERQADLRIVRDTLTGSLIIQATGAQHAKIREMLATMESAPVESRRQVRGFVVRNRQVDDLAGILRQMADGGIIRAAVQTNARANPASAAPSTPGTQTHAGTTLNTGSVSQPTSPPPAMISSGSAAGGKNDLVITTDPGTSTILAMGEPQQLAQLATIIRDLDRRQPQVEIEIIMASLSDNETRDLGVELMNAFKSGGTTTVLGSLFGLGGKENALPSVVNKGTPIPVAPLSTGAGAMVVNPGDFAAVVRALETVTNGSSLVRARLLAGNNVQASIKGVVQEPFSSINAGNTVSTTAYGGTSDAGTQISVTPQIGAGDQVILDYSISQSAFTGDKTTGPDGAIIPPPKRNDEVKSTATIPDSHVIAIGGLSTTSERTSETRVPLLGSIPILGYLFKSTSKTMVTSKNFIFIRTTILRHERFEDLKYISDRQLEQADLTKDGWPVPKPAFLE